ncbi:hypothetical protein ACHAAC_03205 [Aeromicrobium sp. CF4.19]|uniref:hypothetical protein n=1 Tax=Aeromicrobium sp. CF4.19 TaxID=3373082 RepID=UPI003EE73824
MNLRKPAIATAAVVLSLGLTACGGQSVEDACQTANEDATEATSDLSSISPTDPEGSGEMISSLEEELSSSADSLENEEVKTEVQNLADQFGELSGIFAELQEAGEDPDALTEVSGKLTDASSGIMDQAQTLNDLCNA